MFIFTQLTCSFKAEHWRHFQFINGASTDPHVDTETSGAEARKEVVNVGVSKNCIKKYIKSLYKSAKHMKCCKC